MSDEKTNRQTSIVLCVLVVLVLIFTLAWNYGKLISRELTEEEKPSPATTNTVQKHTVTVVSAAGERWSNIDEGSISWQNDSKCILFTASDGTWTCVCGSFTIRREK